MANAKRGGAVAGEPPATGRIRTQSHKRKEISVLSVSLAHPDLMRRDTRIPLTRIAAR